MSSFESLGASFEAIPTLKDGATGRKATYDKTEKLILGWLHTPSPRFFAHKAVLEFNKHLKNISTIDDFNMVLYRGRRKNCLRDPHDAMEYGPPPKDHANLGRYNHLGKPALYLSDSIEGVSRELKASFSNPIGVQEYSFPAKTLEIADLSSANLPNFINMLFAHLERAEYKGSGVDRNYHEHGAFIADIMQEAGYEGMRVPGVRGESGQHYSNIVMFDPEPEWRDWVDRTVLPYIIPPD